MNKFIILNIPNNDSLYLKEVYFIKLIDYYYKYKDLYNIIIISKNYIDDRFETYSSIKDFIYNKEGMFIYFNNPTLIYDVNEIDNIFNLTSKYGNIKIYKKNNFIGIGRTIGSKSLPYIYRNKNYLFQLFGNKSISILNSILQDYINTKHILNGVNIIDPKNTYICFNSNINKDTTIYPFSYILTSSIGSYSLIGPHVTIRNNSLIKDNCRIGNFVEIKNSFIDSNSKIAHLSYIGDSIIGKNVNIGCGVVTCNYDGQNKHQTIIKDNSFIGSNVNLIAPIVVGMNSYVAAGSTIYNNVEDYAFVIERGKQINKKDYAKRFPYYKNTST